jgi:hypothetical protein
VIALVLLGVVVLWAVLGVFLWKWLIRPRFRSRGALVAATLVAAAIWFVGPVLDEILGAQTFKRLCEEMPPIEFYGPIAVGPGVFFDNDGRPRWKSSEDFRLNFWNKEGWTRLFDKREEDQVLLRWPFPVIESRTIIFSNAGQRPIYVWRGRYGSGGWIKRVTGWSRHAPYQCPAKGSAPPSELWIRFKGE